MQTNTHTEAEQCHFETLELHSYRRKIQDLKIRQNVKGVHHCPLYNHLLRKRSNLAYLGCNFVSKEGTLFSKWVSKTINLQTIIWLCLSTMKLYFH